MQFPCFISILESWKAFSGTLRRVLYAIDIASFQHVSLNERIRKCIEETSQGCMGVEKALQCYLLIFQDFQAGVTRRVVVVKHSVVDNFSLDTTNYLFELLEYFQGKCTVAYYTHRYKLMADNSWSIKKEKQMTMVFILLLHPALLKAMYMTYDIIVRLVMTKLLDGN